MSSRGDGYVGAASDVSSDALLAAIVEASDDAVFTHDAEGTMISWDRTAERFFGYCAAEVLGRPMLSLFAEHLREEVRRVLEQVASGDSVRNFETEIPRRDGMPILISLSLCPVFDGHDLPVASVAVARDITEQRLAQAALAEVEARVRESEALAHVGSWLWDLRTGAVQWSDEFHRIHGVDPLDFDGTFESHLTRIHPDDRERVRVALEDSVASGRPFEDKYRVVRPDNEVRRLHARAQPTTGSAGAVLGLRGIGQDVTDRHERDA
jgi:PAS domain S-box-containing protein